MKPVGILLNDEKHTFKDFGLRIVSIKIGLPDVKKSQIDIPGANGSADMTDYFGTRYKNRKIIVECDVEDKGYKNWTQSVSRISNYIHGKNVKLILDVDPGFYYTGRGACEYDKDNRVYSHITLTFECEPYKRELTASDQNWLWDPFSFQNGVIRKYKNLAVNGIYILTVTGSPMEVIPRIVCSTAMQVVFSGQTYQLAAGENYIPDILIKEGEYALTFKGNGTVTVIYRGGSL